ncbi:MAG: FAD-dependent oxidoreductase [Ruminococcaceae bacterium]|nr:FAD-dependent oxidoreductase [Oscillospiraceae bacterium]
MNESIWTKTQTLPSFPRLETDVKTDVLVIGGGIAGILCAYLLQQAGVDYTLVEAGRICCGVSRNTTAKITSQHGLVYHKLLRQFGLEAAQLYYRANEEALAQYRDISRSLDFDFTEEDSFIYSMDDRGKVEKELDALQKIGAKADFAQKLPLPFSVAGAVQFPHQAQMHPLKFLAGLTPGLNIHEHTRVLEFLPGCIRTNGGSIRAKKVIVATHFPFLNKHGSYFLKLYQQRAYVLALENTPHIQGMYADERDDGLSFRQHGDTLLLGGCGQRTGKRSGGWQHLSDFALHNYPGCTITHRWAAQDCMSLDGMPYIGQYAKTTPDLFVATGFNKWGMSSAMVAARLLRDLVLERDNPFSALFSPSRTILRPQLAANAFESTLHLLMPTVPRCPHLGCALKWNRQEHSWDCPCHGSRFSEDGTVLNNPANGDLKR